MPYKPENVQEAMRRQQQAVQDRMREMAQALAQPAPEPVAIDRFVMPDWVAKFDKGKGKTLEPSDTNLWSKLIGNVEEIFEAPSIVAGGAVRDFYLGEPPKDIDLFIRLPDPLTFPKYAEELGWGAFRKVQGKKEHNYKQMHKITTAQPPAVDAVYEFSVFGHQVQTIILSDLGEDFTGENLVKRFDFNAVKCWFDGSKLRSDEAREDLDSKTYTLVVDDRWEQSYDRFRRFQQREGHEDWKLVDKFDAKRYNKWLKQFEANTNPCSEVVFDVKKRMYKIVRG